MLCTLSLSIKLTNTNITFPFPLTYVKNEKESDSPIGFFFLCIKRKFHNHLQQSYSFQVLLA